MRACEDLSPKLTDHEKRLRIDGLVEWARRRSEDAGVSAVEWRVLEAILESGWAGQRAMALVRLAALWEPSTVPEAVLGGLVDREWIECWQSPGQPTIATLHPYGAKRLGAVLVVPEDEVPEVDPYWSFPEAEPRHYIVPPEHEGFRPCKISFEKIADSIVLRDVEGDFVTVSRRDHKLIAKIQGEKRAAKKGKVQPVKAKAKTKGGKDRERKAAKRRNAG